MRARQKYKDAAVFGKVFEGQNDDAKHGRQTLNYRAWFRFFGSEGYARFWAGRDGEDHLVDDWLGASDFGLEDDDLTSLPIRADRSERMSRKGWAFWWHILSRYDSLHALVLVMV